MNQILTKIVLFDKKPYGNEDSFKYFIGYRHKGNAFPSPLCIEPPKMNVYAKYFDKNSKYVNLLVNDKEILENHNAIWIN